MHLVPKPALVLGLITQYGPIEISIAVEEKETLQEVGSSDDGAADRDLSAAQWHAPVERRQSMEVKAEYLAIFSEEASDQLREWEESLLALESDPADREPLNAHVPRDPHAEGIGRVHRVRHAAEARPRP